MTRTLDRVREALTGLFLALLGPRVSQAEVRGEIFRLGNRHVGWPLEGALRELNAPGLAPRRASLLRACVRKLQCP
jgi:hypothetical protein